jgi:hypothetical protein
MWQERNEMFQDTVATWYKSWYPRVPEANGRVFLDKVDDAKDHLPVRTVDMTYLIYRQLLYPLDDWAEKTLAARNQYAEANHLSQREFRLDWKKTAKPAAQHASLKDLRELGRKYIGVFIHTAVPPWDRPWLPLAQEGSPPEQAKPRRHRINVSGFSMVRASCQRIVWKAR